MRFFLQLALFFLIFSNVSYAWENHKRLTELCLQDYQNWETVTPEPIENILSSLAIAAAPKTVEELARALQINGDKIKWNWDPKEFPSNLTGLDVLLSSVDEPDGGMDQNLNLSPDQKYMGGFKGSSSQGFRHMYYRKWNWRHPIVSFHFPMNEMGEGPRRAALFFDFSVQAARTGHLFWAYRFLGWGLHYVEDLGQPYHSNQFASFTLLPVKRLVKEGWQPFIQETTRIVANFHLSFERYVNRFLLRGNSELHSAFRAPQANEEMKRQLEENQTIPIDDGAKVLAVASSELAPQIVAKQKPAWGSLLFAEGIDLTQGYEDATGKSKIDFDLIEQDQASAVHRQAMAVVAGKALSNTSVAVRWYVDRFRSMTAH